ncbi:MAG: Ferrous iron transport protein [Phycisphaerales bacterium]|nr:Ferrous iron transport protein [Phycisphaerales bacterium]
MTAAPASSPLEYRPVPHAPGAPLTVALAGNPNCGKTTLFNALTGLRQKVANYPGVTVEKKSGRCKIPAPTGSAAEVGRAAEGGVGLGEGNLAAVQWVDVIDLPGTYSLVSRSPDERVAMEVLRGLRADTRAPDVVVVVVDASNLQRNLYLVSQLIELGRPMVVALNMTDVAERRGTPVDPAKLSAALGVPVVPVVGHKKVGVDALKAAIGRAAVAPLPAWPLPEAMRAELLAVAGELAELERADEAGTTGPARPADASGPAVKPATSPPRAADRYEALAERLLTGDHADDVAALADRPAVRAVLDGALGRLATRGIDPMQADIEAHYRWIDAVAAGAMAARPDAPADVALPVVSALTGGGARQTGSSPQPLGYAAKPLTATDKVDAVLVHKVWGLLIFAVVMAALFVSIFWLATPVMDAFKNGVEGLGTWVSRGMADGPLKSLVTKGIFAGVGAVVVFVPQIALLFLFLAILEDSGYLARAAFLMDRLLGKVGLSGKAFIPLLSSFACAIPGIMATRTIENRRDRLATIFVAPFMSCSARLPVYGLLIGAFFAGYGPLAKGGIMLACYALGVLAAVITAWCFKRTFLKGPAQAFILELPTYKIPQPSQVARVVWGNTSKFLTKAGTIIFCLSVVLWALNYYPRLPAERAAEVGDKAAAGLLADPSIVITTLLPPNPTPDQIARRDAERAAQATAAAAQVETKRDELREKAVAAAQSEHSVAGRIGHFIEPAIRPLGFDWKMGVGLVSAFAAREVFVSSLGIVYSVGEVEDDRSALEEQIKADRYADGRPVWTPLVAVSLLVWFVLAMQCMSTLAIVRRETGGWAWPVGMLVYMNALAYVCCLVLYQVGSRL